MQNAKKEKNRIYIAIDLKSFFASVECVERGLNPLTAKLVVADSSRTEKTICLAVSPALKAYGIPGRPRLFEVVQKTKAANVEYIVAPPRMALYMEYSTRVYNIYLKYVAPEDMHVYSIDEVFMDVTDYLRTYNMTAEELARKMIYDVLKNTGITATAGIGTNMYLCKIAMDIVAKRMEPDEYGVRMASLDELSYRKLLWNHRPLTDFWRLGKGYAKKLEAKGLYTMGDIARCSLGRDNDYYNEDLLYKMFGINAELLIDHAWGYEPCTMKDIKSYRTDNNSCGSGQVLHCAYEADKARLVVKEMADLLVLDLVGKKLVTNQIVLTIGYDIENLTDKRRRAAYKGEITTDMYGRKVPKHAHGSINLSGYVSSSREIIEAAMELYDRIVDMNLLIRRINIVANNVITQSQAEAKKEYTQISLFDCDTFKQENNGKADKVNYEKESKIQQALLDIKKKYGKNAVVKGMNLEEGATAMDRNRQIGGHKA